MARFLKDHLRKSKVVGFSVNIKRFHIRDFNLQMKKHVKSEYLLMFKLYFVEKRLY